MLVRFHSVVPRWPCCGGLRPSLTPLPPDAADRPADQQRDARLGHRRALHRMRGHVIIQVAERARAAGEPLAVDRRLLEGQLLPLGLAFLLGLGHRDHDPGMQPPRIGAQVDAPVHLGESHPGLVEAGDQVLQVQRLPYEPVPLKAQHRVHHPRVDQPHRLLIPRPVLPRLGWVLPRDPDVVVRQPVHHRPAALAGFGLQLGHLVSDAVGVVLVVQADSHVDQAADDTVRRSCRSSPLCRHHHKCRQRDGWMLGQPEPGVLVWRTPAGRKHTATPTIYDR